MQERRCSGVGLRKADNGSALPFRRCGFLNKGESLPSAALGYKILLSVRKIPDGRFSLRFYAPHEVKKRLHKTGGMQVS